MQSLLSSRFCYCSRVLLKLALWPCDLQLAVFIFSAEAPLGLLQCEHLGKNTEDLVGYMKLVVRLTSAVCLLLSALVLEPQYALVLLEALGLAFGLASEKRHALSTGR